MKLLPVVIILILISGVACAGGALKLFEKVDGNLKCDGKEVASVDGKIANGFSDSFKMDDTNTTVVFHTWATNLGESDVGVKSYVKDLNTDQLKLLKKDARFPSISPNGRYVAYEWSENYETSLPGIYIYDLYTGKEHFAGYTSGGNQYGWQAQEFVWDNNIVSYNSSYTGVWIINKFMAGD